MRYKVLTMRIVKKAGKPMELKKIFRIDICGDTRNWIELIDQFGSDKHRSALDDLDTTVWSLVERKRDELSYYHGKKRAAVHLGNCYQEAITKLLTEVLVSKGISDTLIHCVIDGVDTKYFVDGELLRETEQIERLIKLEDTGAVKAVYSNEIFAMTR